MRTGVAIQTSNYDWDNVVLPSRFLDERKYRDLITIEWKAEVRTYSMHRFKPNEYTSFLYEGIEDFYRNEGYL